MTAADRSDNASVCALISDHGNGSASASQAVVLKLAKLAAALIDAPMGVITRTSLGEQEALLSFGFNDNALTTVMRCLAGLAPGGADRFAWPSPEGRLHMADLQTSGNGQQEQALAPLRTSGIRSVVAVRLDSAACDGATMWLFDAKTRDVSRNDEACLIEIGDIISYSLTQPRARDASYAEVTPQQQELIHTVLNALFVFVGILDLDGTLLDTNDPPLQAAALTIEDVRGRHFWDCYWWSYSEESKRRLRHAVKNARQGKDVRCEAQVRLADDCFIAIDFFLSPLRDASGRITHLVASGVDISQRRSAETELGRMVRIVDEAPFLIRSASPDGRVLYLNKRGREMLGYATNAPLGQAEVAHHHPDWASRILSEEGYPKARKDGQWVGETAILDTDGREVPVSAAIVAHRDAEGSVEYFSTIAGDISSVKSTQAALKESELRFRGTFENAAVGIAHVGLEGRWLRVNERLLEIVGYRRAELVQMTFQDITHPDDLDADLALFAQLKAGDIDSYSLDKRYYRKDGEVVWVEITVSMQEASGQSGPYIIAVVEDITQRKLAEDRQRLLLAELNHRVKNTLAMIQSIANQTLRESTDPRNFVRCFTGRLQSLSGAHDLLTAQTWSGADLAALLRTQVSLNGTIDVDRIRLAGPKVLLPPQVALNLALIVHELATNALQHGAFSTDAGSVSVNWSISMSPAAQEKFLQIVWSETGGPPVKEPEERGFGTVILERGLKLGLGGTYELQWERGGLVAKLCMPLPASGYRKELFQT